MSILYAHVNVPMDGPRYRNIFGTFALMISEDIVRATSSQTPEAGPTASAPAALAHEPHRIAFYLYDLAAAFHALWNRGKELPHLRFMVEASREITEARLALVTSTAIVLRSALRLLGVQAITEMR